MAKVTVRVAVAVDATGAWCSAGWSGESPMEDFHAVAAELLGPDCAHYWLEAELDIPEAQIVRAAVTRVEES